MVNAHALPPTLFSLPFFLSLILTLSFSFSSSLSLSLSFSFSFSLSFSFPLSFSFSLSLSLCSKSAAQFQSMEVRNDKFAAFIDFFTTNTYVMVIMSDPTIRA